MTGTVIYMKPKITSLNVTCFKVGRSESLADEGKIALCISMIDDSNVSFDQLCIYLSPLDMRKLQSKINSELYTMIGEGRIDEPNDT
jgi:hypothetical protein